jgi:large subunit ribosomal protein L1
MANIEENFLKSIQELRKTEKKHNFSQTIDLIANLKDFDVRREAFSVFITLPHKIKEKKVMAFLEKKSKIIDSIVREEFDRYKEKKDAKKLIKQYDFFISNAKLMPAVASSFGRVLGPTGKMPSPQLGIILSEDDKIIEGIVNRINSTVRVRVKEPSIKIGVGKESLKDSEIVDNLAAVYNKLIETLPRKKDNLRNIKIKLTMGKPVNVEI